MTVPVVGQGMFPVDGSISYQKDKTENIPVILSQHLRCHQQQEFINTFNELNDQINLNKGSFTGLDLHAEAELI